MPSLQTFLNKKFKKGKKEHPSVTARFVLCKGKLRVGILEAKNNKWHFKYTSEFKAQNEYKLLVQFPYAEKEYVSEELWPYFAT